MNAHTILTPTVIALDAALAERTRPFVIDTISNAQRGLDHQRAKARLLELRAERDKLQTETLDLFCAMTEQQIHYADEDLADWDRAHGGELDALIEELGA